MFKVILRLHSKLKASLGYISEPITKKNIDNNNKKLLKSSRKGTRTTTSIKIPLPQESGEVEKTNSDHAGNQPNYSCNFIKVGKNSSA